MDSTLAVWIRALPLILFASSACCQIYCVPGYGFPEFCPRPGDPADFTQCCKNYYSPACCQPRANVICTGKKGSSTSLPSIDQRAIWCPGPDQSDDMTACCSTGSSLTCCSKSTLIGAIVGGVVGLLLLIGIIVTVSVCCCVKTGKCCGLVCVQVGPGKWKGMTKSQAEQYYAMTGRQPGQPWAPPTGQQVNYNRGAPSGGQQVTYGQKAPEGYGFAPQPGVY